MNEPNNESGYGSGLGYGSMTQGSSDAQGYGTQGYGNHDSYLGQDYATDAYGYGVEGYGEEESNPYGAGLSPWHTDHVSDGYRENVFEVNVEDTAYTETLSNPNPHISGYSQLSTVEEVVSLPKDEEQIQLEP
jgi:hypothetical protein